MSGAYNPYCFAKNVDAPQAFYIGRKSYYRREVLGSTSPVAARNNAMAYWATVRSP